MNPTHNNPNFQPDSDQIFPSPEESLESGIPPLKPENAGIGQALESIEGELQPIPLTPNPTEDEGLLWSTNQVWPQELVEYDLSNWQEEEINLSWTQEEQDYLLQFHDSQGTLLESQNLADISGVRIKGTTGDDTVKISSWDFPLNIELTFEGGAGNDSLWGPGNDSQWLVTGENEGYLQPLDQTGKMGFHGVENLIGGANNEETFLIEENGSLSGIIEGGDGGFDTLETEEGTFEQIQFITTGPDRGWVILDGTPIYYQGLEPVTDNSLAQTKVFNATAGNDQLSISDDLGTNIIIDSINNTFEDHTIREPSQLLTINTGEGDDNIAFNAVFNNNKFYIDGGEGNDTIDVSGRAVNMKVIEYSDGSAAIVDSSTYVLTRGIENFVGFNGTIIETGIPPWLEQGPSTISGGQVLIPPDNPVSGAINAVAPHPFDANIMYIASVNGGIWRSTDGGSTWTTKTDQFPSLSVGDIKISPLDADGNLVNNATPLNKLVVYAGTGKFSSFRSAGGFNVGLYKSTDGGENWSIIAPTNIVGLDITAVVPTRNKVGGQPVVLVSSLSKIDGGGVVKEGGIFRSTDGGQTFSKIVGGEATDLVADPGNANRFYAGVKGKGIMVTTDGGATWNTVPNGGPSLAGDSKDNDLDGTPDNTGESAATAGRILLAVQQATGNNNAVFAAIIGNSNNNGDEFLMDVFR
ncbi:MAG: WD40/YVTN/BNR-like repeat-containing protein, partial [Crocosphaera sp.]